jgi:thioredoxin reductase (NADPH)
MKHIFLFLLIGSIPFLSTCSNHKKSEKQQPSCNLTQVVFDAQTYPVIILGGGVAGLTSASYLAQANIPSIVVEGEKPGGALAQSDSVRNWPGVINSPGAIIVTDIKKQVQANGVTISKEKVITLDFEKFPYEVTVQDLQTKEQRVLKGLTCIIAMGAEPNYLGITGERGEGGYWGKGVTNCAVCDGALYRGKNVAVVGGGDSAIVEASYLSGIAKSVTVFVRKDHFRAKDKRKRDDVIKRHNVTVQYNTQVKQVLGNGNKVTNLIVSDATTNETKTIPMDGLFLAIGSQPNTLLFQKFLTLDPAGYVVLNNEQETSVKGIFAAGDVCDPVYKQAVTSASDGCKAALQAQAYLDELGFDVGMIHGSVKLAESTADQEALGIFSDEELAEEEFSVVQSIKSVDEFKKLVSGYFPVIIDFYANLCIPCQNMAPIVEKIAEKYSRSITFAKVNLSDLGMHLDEMRSCVEAPEITMAPTFLFIRDGKEVSRLVDEVSAQDFEHELKKMIELPSNLRKSNE